MPATRDRLHDRIADAISNGIEPQLLPGLKSTTERVLDAVRDQEYALTMADRDLLFDRIARLETLAELQLRARLITLAPTSELRAEIEEELGLAREPEQAPPMGGVGWDEGRRDDLGDQ